MKKAAFITFIFFAVFNCKSQIVRKYFFDDHMPINDSASLILIIDNPQSKFAKTLNHRIYRDTNFIKYLKESWFIEYDKSTGHSSHRCGYDMYFYYLSGGKYTYLNCLNSNCKADKIGDNNLNLLLQMGSPLKVDTLTRISVWTDKDSIFNDNLIEARYENHSEWNNTKTKKYPIIYYDMYFKTKIQLDTNFTINQNAANFIRTFSNDMEGINWNMPKYSYHPSSEEDFLIKDFVDHNIPCEIDITVYFKSSKIHLFKEYDIKEVYFNIKRGRSLLLFYNN